MRVVPKVQTPLSEVGLALALRAGHELAEHAAPSKARLGVAWAQNALEHDRGRAIYNNNVGNVTAWAKYTGDAYDFGKLIPERVKRGATPAEDVWEPKHLFFRAHASPELGATDYWRVLASEKFASALPYFDRGDANGAAWELSRRGYYTARAEKYSVAMVSLLGWFERSIWTRIDAAPETHALTPDEQAAIAHVCDRVAKMADDARRGVEGLAAFEEAWPRRAIDVPTLP